MGLVEVDVVRAEATQGTVDGLHDVFASEATVVLAFTGGEVHLGEDLQAFAPHAFECCAEGRLCTGAGIGVGGVEGGDTQVEGLADACVCGVLVDLLTMGDPVSIGQFTDVHAGRAEFAVFHIAFLSLSGVKCSGWSQDGPAEARI